MRTTRFFALVLSLLLAVSFGAVSAQDNDATPEPTHETPEPYRIGAFLSLSGPLASLGQPEQNTLQLIVRQVNALGGIEGPDGQRHSVVLTIYDDESNPQLAAQHAEQLIAQDEAVLLIGGSGTVVSLPVIEIATEAEIPFISLAGSSDIVRMPDGSQQPWVFKATQNENRTFEVILDWLQARGIERVASLGANNAYGSTSMSVLAEMLAAAGIDLVYEDRFPEGTDDFSAYLSEIAGSDAEVVIAHATAIDASLLTLDYQASGLVLPLVHTPGVGNQAFLAMAGDSSEGAYVSIGKLLVASQLPEGDRQRATLLNYIDAYVSAYMEPVSTFGGHAYDALYMALFALQASGPDPAALRDYLENDVQDFIGITGVYNMSPDDHSGVGPGAMVMVQIVDGAWQYVPPEAYPE